MLFYSHLGCALAVCFAVGGYLLWAMQLDLQRASSEKLGHSLHEVEALLASAMQSEGSALSIESIAPLRDALTELMQVEKLAQLEIKKGDQALFISAAAESEASTLRSAVVSFDSSVTVLISTDSKAQVERLRDIRNHALLGFIGAVLASLLFAKVLAQRAQSMLTPLLDRFDQIAQGNFDARLPVKADHRDAFARVAQAFNAMSEKLQQSIKGRERTLGQLKQTRDQLEHSVRDRTVELNNLNDLLRHEHEQRAQLEASLAEAAATDSLTKLLNRRSLLELLRQVHQELKKQGKNCCIAILDVDHFKQVNDRFGHDVGDQVLIGVGKVIREHLGHQEAAARWGGEEFIVAWPDQPLKVAEQRADRLRGLIADGSFAGGKLQITVSFGVAEWHTDETLEPALQRADQALYRAKADGRNRVRTLARSS